MNYIQHQLRSQPLTAVFEITRRVMVPAVVAYLVSSIISLLLFVPLIGRIMGLNFDNLIALANSSDPMEQQRFFRSLIEDGMLESMTDPMTWLWIILAIVLVSLVNAWLYNVLLISNEYVVKGQRPQLGNVLSQGFNANMLWLFLATILVSLVLFVTAFLAAIVIDALGFLIAIPVFLFIVVFSMRMILVYPAIVHGGRSVGEAFLESFRHIGWMRALKYLGAGILFFISLLVVTLLISLVQGALSAIPAVGVVFSLLFNVLFSALLIGLMLAALTGVYYRHTEDLPEDGSEMSLEDHLLS